MFQAFKVRAKTRRFDLAISDLVISPYKPYDRDGTNLFFDAAWYAERYGERVNPLDHFLWVGQYENLSPHPLFNAGWYVSKNPDVQVSGMGAAQHFLHFGAHEGRSPNPLFSTADYVRKVTLGAFRNPLFHYLALGEKLGINPHWLFDADWFRKEHGLPADVNALNYYYSNSDRIDLSPHPLFDAAFYRANNTDVWQDGQNVVEHFLEHGGSEGRAPSRLFDATYYRSLYHDTRLRNPLQHYILYGDAEGRKPHPLFETAWYRQRWANYIRNGETALGHYRRELGHRRFQSHPDLRMSERFDALQGRKKVPPAVVSQAHGQVKTVLIVNHALGGGTQIYVEDIAALLSKDGHTVWTLVYHPQTALFSVRNQQGEQHYFDLQRTGQPQKALHFLGECKFDLIHFNQVLGAPSFVRTIAETLKVPYVVTIHDFYWCNPRITLVDGNNKLQEGYDLKEWERCIRLHGTYPMVSDEWSQVSGLKEWRSRSASFLSRAASVLVPSADTAVRVKRDLGIEALVKPHPVDGFPIRLAAPPANGPVRIAVIGAIGFEKGFNLILQCAEEAYIRSRKIEFVVIGEVREPEKLEPLPNVKITGRFPGGLAEQMIRSERCHAALFLSLWPETYSYTLTEALKCGLFPVSLDVGAIAERLRALDWGHLLPLNAAAEDINAVLEKIVEIRREPPKSFFKGVRYPWMITDYFELADMPAAKLRA